MKVRELQVNGIYKGSSSRGGFRFIERIEDATDTVYYHNGNCPSLTAHAYAVSRRGFASWAKKLVKVRDTGGQRFARDDYYVKIGERAWLLDERNRRKWRSGKKTLLSIMLEGIPGITEQAAAELAAYVAHIHS